jgi:protoporphyrinogen oxidase
MENAAQFNGLHLNNNAYSGVGINDCVAAAYRSADKIIARTIAGE